MLIPLDNTKSTPLYMQLYHYMKRQILTGAITAKTKLPSKRELAQTNGISQNTVILAYEQLEQEGYIKAKQRSGYYVLDIQHSYHLEIDQKEQLPLTKQQPIPYYDFSSTKTDSNLFPFTVFRKIHQQIFQEQQIDLLAPTQAQGSLALRQQLQHYLTQSRNVPCSAEQIILGPNSQYLWTILFYCLEITNCFGFENPGYHNFVPLCHLHGHDVTFLAIDNYGISPTALATTKANCLYISPNHQFPTGNIMPIERRQALLQWASQQPNRYIIEDDYDSEFKYEGRPIPSMKNLDREDCVIYMGSFSRVLASGLRVSYMVLPKTLLEKFRMIESSLTCPLNSFTQKALQLFIEQGHLDKTLNKARNLYRKKRKLLIQELQKLDPNGTVLGSGVGLHLLWKSSIPLFATQSVKLSTLGNFYKGTIPQEAQTIYFFSFSSLSINDIPKAVQHLKKKN